MYSYKFTPHIPHNHVYTHTHTHIHKIRPSQTGLTLTHKELTTPVPVQLVHDNDIVILNAMGRFLTVNRNELDFIIRHATVPDEVWGGRWGWGSHEGFMRTMHDLGMQYVQNAYSDPFFHTIHRLLGGHVVREYDLRNKLKWNLIREDDMYFDHPPHWKQTHELMKTFMDSRAGTGMRAFVEYRTGTQNTPLFIMLVRSARALNHLSHEQRHAAHMTWHPYATHFLRLMDAQVEDEVGDEDDEVDY
jgi:hypothetical protein